MSTTCKALGVNYGKPCWGLHASAIPGLLRCCYCHGYVTPSPTRCAA